MKKPKAIIRCDMGLHQVGWGEMAQMHSYWIEWDDGCFSPITEENYELVFEDGTNTFRETLRVKERVGEPEGWR